MFRIGWIGGLLWTQLWHFGLRKMPQIYWLDEELSACEEEIRATPYLTRTGRNRARIPGCLHRELTPSSHLDLQIPRNQKYEAGKCVVAQLRSWLSHQIVCKVHVIVAVRVQQNRVRNPGGQFCTSYRTNSWQTLSGTTTRVLSTCPHSLY
jgi:hypothetical protein